MKLRVWELRRNLFLRFPALAKRYRQRKHRLQYHRDD